MNRIRAPYLTLLAGAILAAVLLGLDVRATPSQNVAQRLGSVGTVGTLPVATPTGSTSSAAAPGSGATPSGSFTVIGSVPSSPAAPAATSTAATPNPAVHDYAGRVDGGSPSLAISIYEGKAIAYVCGGGYEVWFTGTAQGGKLALSSRYGAALTGSYDTTGVHGLVVGSGHHWTFTAPTVKAPSGLYRAYTKKEGVKLQATWIVLPDGSQTGAEDAGGDTATAAPVGPINFSTGSAVLTDGQAVQPVRIDGSGAGSASGSQEGAS
jgi:hypothetical protein